MNEFTLTIKLGNAAMQDYCDIADALTRLGALMADYAGGTPSVIMDQNGNRVGEWKVSN